MGRLLSAGRPQTPQRSGSAGRHNSLSSLKHNPVAMQLAASPHDVAATSNIVFYLAATVIFVRMSVLPEMVAYLTGSSTYILYLIAPPALIAIFVTGGLQRLFRYKVAWCWTGFFFWMLLATPFSFWPGGSALTDSNYARTNYICLLVLGASVTNWKQIKIFFNIMAAAGAAVLAIGTFLGKTDAEGRRMLDVTDSTIGNANDLAAHVLLLMPFLALVALTPRRNFVLRLACGALSVYSVWLILSTSSRGALIGLTAAALVLFLKANGSQRLVVMFTVPVLALAVYSVLPAQNRQRLATVFSSDDTSSEVAGEAGESRDTREYVLRKSIQYSFEHPVFGVGPDQFLNFEGSSSRQQGLHGSWHATHNTYTQISSECGIPALILALCGLFGALHLANKTYKNAIKQGNKDMARFCLCYLTSLAGYLVTLFFLGWAYTFTLPSMISLAIAMHFAGERELFGGSPKQEPAGPGSRDFAGGRLPVSSFG